ncbi:hypothetical protein ACJX0J_023941, partial [Zea mays]
SDDLLLIFSANIQISKKNVIITKGVLKISFHQNEPTGLIMLTHGMLPNWHALEDILILKFSQDFHACIEERYRRLIPHKIYHKAHRSWNHHAIITRQRQDTVNFPIVFKSENGQIPNHLVFINFKLCFPIVKQMMLRILVDGLHLMKIIVVEEEEMKLNIIDPPLDAMTRRLRHTIPQL